MCFIGSDLYKPHLPPPSPLPRFYKIKFNFLIIKHSALQRTIFDGPYKNQNMYDLLLLVSWQMLACINVNYTPKATF